MKKRKVQNQTHLKDAYAEWKKALAGPHKSIWSRAVSAWHDYAFFRCVSHGFSEAAKTSRKDDLPYGLMNAYHRAFYKSVMVELRSAIGGDNDSLWNPKNGEYSIRAVLRSMGNFSITRESLFELNEIEYEFESKKRLDEKEFLDFIKSGGSGILPSSHASWHFSKELHDAIDTLCGCDEATRSSQDTIPVEVFQKAESELKNQCGNLLIFVNKHVTHAATQQSIETANLRVPDRINAHDIEKAFGALTGTYDMLASDLFRMGHFSFNLDISTRLKGVEEALGQPIGAFRFKEFHHDLTRKFERNLRVWRPF